MMARDRPEHSAQGVNGEPVTRSSREGVHLELQIKHGGLGPHGGALHENGLFRARWRASSLKTRNLVGNRGIVTVSLQRQMMHRCI